MEGTAGNVPGPETPHPCGVIDVQPIGRLFAASVGRFPWFKLCRFVPCRIDRGTPKTKEEPTKIAFSLVVAKRRNIKKQKEVPERGGGAVPVIC